MTDIGQIGFKAMFGVISGLFEIYHFLYCAFQMELKLPLLIGTTTLVAIKLYTTGIIVQIILSCSISTSCKIYLDSSLFWTLDCPCLSVRL